VHRLLGEQPQQGGADVTAGRSSAAAGSASAAADAARALRAVGVVVGVSWVVHGLLLEVWFSNDTSLPFHDNLSGHASLPAGTGLL
jgi:hypothetical protein